MRPLKDQVAIVTGAASGMGAGLAKMLAAAEVKVALTDLDNDGLQHVAAEIRGAGGTALAIPADVRDERALSMLVDQTQRTLGPVDILVNSAGVLITQPIHAMDMDQWDWVMAVNLRAPVFLCAALLSSMRERRHGYIVNLCSEAGVFVYHGMGAYCVSKHALRVVTELIQQENQDCGIKALAICPGVVNTPLAKDLPGTNPANFLTVEEVVNVVHFLLTQGENVKLGPEILIRTMRNPSAS